MLRSIATIYHTDTIETGAWQIRIENDLSFIRTNRSKKTKKLMYDKLLEVIEMALPKEDIKKIVVKDYEKPKGDPFRFYSIHKPFD